jgi:hypothetical protein
MLFSFLSSPCLCASVVQSGPRNSHYLFERFVGLMEGT